MKIDALRADAVVLRVQGVSKAFGPKPVLQGVSFEVREGEFVTLLGPSGTGKSTLLKAVSGLLPYDSGDIQFRCRAGADSNGAGSKNLKPRIGFVFQSFNLINRLSAIDNVLAAFIAQAPAWRVLVRRFSDEQRQLALAMLDAVGMLEYAYQRAEQLSGGQKERVAIARALAQNPELILADEPISSLDPMSASNILSILREAALERRIPVVCSLHQIDHALAVSDRLLGMSAGRIVVDCKPSQLTADHRRDIYGETTT